MSQFIGEDAEEEYAKIFGVGLPVGGFGDNGLDVKTGDPEVPLVQVKSSVKGAMDFFKESVKRKRFIPICIGEPGAKEEMLSALKNFGAWVAKDIPGRTELLEQISSFRKALINQAERGGQKT